MPICRNCKNIFPNYVKINGTSKNISSRKYCLDCSPFGSKNRNKLENDNSLDKRKLEKPKEIEFIVDANNCHICTSHKPNKNGYYGCFYNGKRMLLHRYMWEKEKSRIPEKMVLRHKCDNPSCINLDHLELGTHKENMQDMVDRGRSLVGSKNIFSKLTEDHVREIRLSNLSNDDLAEAYNVSNRTIRDIRARRCWKHI